MRKLRTRHTNSQITPGVLMYHNVSRGASPSATSRRVTKVDLETIEELQDAWCKRYETLRDAPPQPLLNSPRSLRACALAKVSPQSSLQKLSLKQHLFCVLGNPQTLTSLPDSATAEYRVLMQSALRSFREAAVGLGTSQEKLAAFIAFKHQEKLRVPQLASLRELRLQLIAAEALAERKHHHEQLEDDAFMRSGSASVTYRNVGGQGARPCFTVSGNLSWPVCVNERDLRSPRSSASQQLEESITDGRTARGRSSRHRPWPPVFLASVEAVNEGGYDDTCGIGPLDFQPTPSPSGKPPYTPRDVSVLNSSYFSNRSIQRNVSNPSGAPLPSSSPGTPSLSGRGSTSATRSVKPATRRQQSRLTRECSLGTVRKLNDEVSLPGGETKESVELHSIAKQDLSIISINSSELERLLNTGEQAASSRLPVIGQSSAVAVLAARQESLHDELPSTHAVALFHEPDEERGSRPAVATAADETIHATSTTFTAELTSASRRLREYKNHSDFVPQLLPNMLVCPVSPRAEKKAASNSSSFHVAKMTLSGNGKDTARQRHEVAVSAMAIPMEYAAPAESAGTIPKSGLPCPPLITQAEETEGFLYYCVNPSHSITSFLTRGSEPLAVATKL